MRHTRYGDIVLARAADRPASGAVSDSIEDISVTGWQTYLIFAERECVEHPVVEIDLLNLKEL